MIIFLAALLDVPREQYEAAELDGANGAAARPLRHAARTSSRCWSSRVVTGVIAALQYFTEAAVASARRVAARRRRRGRRARRSATPTTRCSPTPSGSTCAASATSSSATPRRSPCCCSSSPASFLVAAAAPRQGLHARGGARMTATTLTATDPPPTGAAPPQPVPPPARHASWSGSPSTPLLAVLLRAVPRARSCSSLLTSLMTERPGADRVALAATRGPSRTTSKAFDAGAAAALVRATRRCTRCSRPRSCCVSSVPAAYALARDQVPRRERDLPRDHRRDAAAAADHGRAALRDVGQARADRHAAAADPAEPARRRVLDLPAAAVLPHHPAEYSDAARIDGASEWGILLRVDHPDGAAGHRGGRRSSCSSTRWNDYYGPLLYTSREPGVVAGRLRARDVPRQSRHRTGASPWRSPCSS